MVTIEQIKQRASSELDLLNARYADGSISPAEYSQAVKNLMWLLDLCDEDAERAVQMCSRLFHGTPPSETTP